MEPSNDYWVDICLRMLEKYIEIDILKKEKDILIKERDGSELNEIIVLLEEKQRLEETYSRVSEIKKEFEKERKV